MALQDLTPQLRTRLSRMERAVGWFVLLAMGLLLFGFGYYFYNTAVRKGWFLTKAPYFLFVSSATGLRVGDPVMLMGFEAGAITQIKPMPGDQFTYNVYVQVELKAPNYGYIWTDGSHARVASADFLGKRVVELTKGTGGYPTYVFNPLRVVSVGEARLLPELQLWKVGEEIYDQYGTSVLARALTPLDQVLAKLNATGTPEVRTLVVLDAREERKMMTGMWNFQSGSYQPYTNNVSEYWLLADESPAVTERLETLIDQVQQSLPGVFHLTNELAGVLSNTAALTSNLNAVAISATPAVSNLVLLTAQLHRPGALGEWLLPTNINRSLENTLDSASDTLASADTNLTSLVLKLSASLDNLAGITSNLNEQVQANTNILSGVSQVITNANDLVQGLKRHWLLRSAFRSRDREDSTPREPPRPIRSPKDASR